MESLGFDKEGRKKVGKGRNERRKHDILYIGFDNIAVFCN